MKIELEIDTEKITSEGVRAQILKGAVAKVMEELTPQRMEVFVQKLLENALQNAFLYDLEMKLKEQARELIAETLRTNAEGIKTRMQTEVTRGVEDALTKVREHVRDMVAKDIPLILHQRMTGRYPP